MLGGSDPEEFLSFLVGDLLSMHAPCPTSRLLLLILRLTFTHFLGISQPETAGATAIDPPCMLMAKDAQSLSAEVSPVPISTVYIYI